MKTLYRLILLTAIALFMLGVLLIAMPAYSQEKLVLNLHLGSYHAGSTGWWSAETGKLTDYNESNPGLGLSYQFGNNYELRGGGYKNSHNENSFYLGGAVYTNSKRLFGIGLVAGAVTGYDGLILNPDIDYKPIQPFAMPTVFINYGKVRSEIGYIPAITNGAANTLTFTTGVRF
jgi:hypothetical protein